MRSNLFALIGLLLLVTVVAYAQPWQLDSAQVIEPASMIAAAIITPSSNIGQTNAGTQLDPMFPLAYFPTPSTLTAAAHWFLSPIDGPVGMAVTTMNPSPTSYVASIYEGYTSDTTGTGTGRFNYLSYQHPDNSDPSADVWLFGSVNTGGTIRLDAPGPQNGRYGHLSFQTCPGGCAISSFTRALDNGADRSFLIMDDGAGGNTISANALNATTCDLDGNVTNPSCTVNVTVRAQKCTCTIGGATSLATIQTCGLGDIVLGAPSTRRVYGGVAGSTRTATVICF